MIKKILRLPKKLFLYAGSLVMLPRKDRHQNLRLDQLEQQLDVTRKQLQMLSSHLPVMLNYVSSFANTSRELRRGHDELARGVDEQVGRLWERLEFVRREILYEFMIASGRSITESAKTEKKIINREKLDSMNNDLRVNMGCGNLPLVGYLNLDMRELPGVDIVCSVDDMPFEQESVSELFSAHLIEHFPQEELQRKLLPYWHGIIKPGGEFRALLPDWESMIAKFVDGEFAFDDLREVTFGAQDYNGDFHFNMFSQQSLRSALEATGFRDISFPVTGRPKGKCEEMEVRAVKASP